MNTVNIKKITSRLYLWGSIFYFISSYLLLLRDSEQVKNISFITKFPILNSISAWSLHSLKINHSSWLLFATSLIILWLAYYLIIKTKVIISRKIIIIVYVLFISSYPSLSTDVFDYINSNRITWVYHQNPYVHIMNEYPNDIFAPLGRWQSKNLPYGQAHFIITAPIQLAANDNLILQIACYKLLQLACITLIAWSLKYLVNNQDNNLYHPVLWIINPVVLIEIMGNLHNDVVMMALFLLGLVLLRTKKYMPGILIFTLSIMTKFITLLYLPALVISSLAQRKHRWNKLGQVGIIMISIFIFLIVSNKFLPRSWDTFLGQNTLYWGSTPGAIFHFLRQFHVSSLLVNISRGVPIFIAAIILLWFYKRKSLREPLEWYVILVLIYMLLASSLVWPWYILWVLPVSFLLTNIKLQLYTWLLSFALSLQYLVLNLSYYFSPNWWGWQIVFWGLLGLPVLLLVYNKVLSKMLSRLFII